MQNLRGLTAIALLTVALAGCLSEGPTDGSPDDPATGGPGQGGDNPASTVYQHRISSTGANGPEPSIGVTSDGCIFVTTDVSSNGLNLPGVSKSCDLGQTWEGIAAPPLTPVNDNDPYLWVDPDTDRVFLVAMQNLACTWISWTDDGGANWLGNPADCGPVPVNDHIKIGTGPWVEGSEYGTIGGDSPAYANAVYFCYNKLVGVFCYTSFDGGATFPVGGQIVGLATTGAGLHGAIETAPDGTVYVPPRTATPMVVYSKDNGFSWTSVTMGEDVGTPDPRKNSEVATDTESNAYHVWTGGDQGIYMSRSTDSGVSWEQESIRISPDRVISTAFPHIDAGDPGRIAVAYLGSDDTEFLGTEDIDGEEWDGNPHYAPANVTYDLYITYSTNALDADPEWTTVKVTEDPVQVGSICISSGDCRDIGGSNRNLLDFNDLHIGPDGRVHVVFADGCTEACADDWPDVGPEDSRSRVATVVIQTTGPSLYADVPDFTAP